jgi:hypothetical protein
MASQDRGLAVMVYAPCVVSTVVRGVPVEMEVATEYPFRGGVEIRVASVAPLAFPLHLRVPEGESPVLMVNGEKITPTARVGFVRLEREWRRGDVLSMKMEMKPLVVEGAMGTVSVMRGPLVFSLPIRERWTKIRDRGLTADWEIFGDSPWNYGLTQATEISVKEQPIGVIPFAKATPPVTLLVEGVRLNQWRQIDGTADAPPQEVKTAGEKTALELVPYASTKLRITSFPRDGERS